MSFCLFFSLYSNAQNGFNQDERLMLSMHEVFAVKANIPKTIDLSIKNVELVDKPFLKGKIFFKGKETSEVYYLRYNGLSDLIEITKDGISDSVLRNTRITCLIGESNYVFAKMKSGNNFENGYLKLIFSSENLKLYEREVVIYKKAKQSITSLTPDISARYIQFKSFYTIDQSSEIAHKVKLNKNNFIKSLDKKFRKKIALFIKKNSIQSCYFSCFCVVRECMSLHMHL